MLGELGVVGYVVQVDTNVITRDHVVTVSLPRNPEEKEGKGGEGKGRGKGGGMTRRRKERGGGRRGGEGRE